MSGEPTLEEILTGHEDEASASRAPALPVEGPIVRATRALEALKAQADLALMVLEHLSHDPVQLQSAIDGVIAQTNAASTAIWQLGHLRTCRGQA